MTGQETCIVCEWIRSTCTESVLHGLCSGGKLKKSLDVKNVYILKVKTGVELCKYFSSSELNQLHYKTLIDFH